MAKNVNDRVRVTSGADEYIGWTGQVVEIEGDLLTVCLDEGDLGTGALVFEDEVEAAPSWNDLKKSQSK